MTTHVFQFVWRGHAFLLPAHNCRLMYTLQSGNRAMLDCSVFFLWLIVGPLLSNPSLTHWDRVTHICVGNLIIIGSYNGLAPGRRQAIIWTNAGILLIGPLGTNFREILIEIHTFAFQKMHLKTPSDKWRPFCLSLNVLTWYFHVALEPHHVLDWISLLNGHFTEKLN